MSTKLYKKEKYATEKEWFDNRGIGGSGASALLDCNPYMTSLDIYCSAVNETKNEPNENENESTLYGHLLEPVIREVVKYNLSSKYKVQSPNGYTMYRRIDKPFMTATLDGVMTDLKTKEKWVLEIKTHDLRGYEDRQLWANGIPKNYLIQCLHYLAVLNDFVGALLVAKLRTIDYETGLVDKEEINYYYIKREDAVKTIAMLEQTETDFWNNHVLPRIPPSVAMPLMEEERKEEDE